MKRIIITGPTGAIGMALIQKCITENIEAAVICHRGSGRIAQITASDKIKVIECNLDELKTLPEVLTGTYDAFFHLAWACTAGEGRNDVHAQSGNIRFALDAAEAAKKLGCECFVGAGSQAEYGRFEGKLDSRVPAFPENGYGIAKLCAGQLSRIRCSQLGIRHIWFRILSVYGEYDGEQTMIMSSIRKMLAGQSPEYTPAEQIWDYLYSVDAAEALFLAAKQGRDGAVYCLGSGQARPLKEYIEIMRDEIQPGLLLKLGAKPYAPKQVMYLCADISELRKDTGFEPQYSFEEGIRRTIEWVQSAGE
ncbi:MAG: NAD(P)-dependent oxidoreductase [Lachnospiraceae bacterium]|nr:NAD(P)-dependent oxidoreductase [Lachnospiraceae bacterium]